MSDPTLSLDHRPLLPDHGKKTQGSTIRGVVVFRQPEIEALIVGAGPVGLCHALALAREGARVRIIDEEWRTAAQSYALTLHPRTLELVSRLIPVDELIERGIRIETVAFYEGTTRRAESSLGDLGTRFPFALVLPQSELESMLESHLEETGTNVHWNERLLDLRYGDGWTSAEVGRLAPSLHDRSQGRWRVESTYEIRSHFVVGADGAHSRVRDILEIEDETFAPRQLFGVFEFESDDYREPEARVVFHEDTTNVLWPLPGGKARWSFEMREPVDHVDDGKRRVPAIMSVPDEPELDERQLAKLLAERAPWFAAPIGPLSWSATVAFQHRLVSQFGFGHVWLAGDAAHQTGPVGVQSMNVALREAGDLVELMMGIFRDEYSLDELTRYDLERSAEWRELLGASAGPRDGNPAGDDWVSRNRARILPCLPASGDDLDQLFRATAAIRQES